MLNYPPALEAVIKDLTARDIIICGYAFNDMCVMRAFNASKDAGSIYFVNPSGAVGHIKGFLPARRSQEKVIEGDLGKFDAFIDALYTQLTAPDVQTRPGARQNLFKFLDGYREDQTDYFIGRRWLRKKLVKQIAAGPVHVHCLTGKANVGKTSLVRAGVMADLKIAGHAPVYFRCRARADLATELRAELARQLATSFDGLDLPATLSRIHDSASSRVVIFLDQFERPCRAADEDDVARQSLLAFVNDLVERAGERLTVVFVSVDEGPFWKLMLSASDPQKRAMTVVRAFSRRRCPRLIRCAAARGGVPLSPAIVTALSDEYQRGLSEKSDGHQFGLTHVQTVCYYLTRGSQQTWQGPGRLPPSLAAALDSLKEEASLLDVLEDLPTDERRLLRTFSRWSATLITVRAESSPLIKKHFPDIREDRFPEPIV